MRTLSNLEILDLSLSSNFLISVLSVFCQDGTSLFQARAIPLSQRRASEDVTSDEERMVICEEDGDDDVMG